MAGMKGKGIPVANSFAILKPEEELEEERRARRKLEQKQHDASAKKNDEKRSNKPKKSSEKKQLQQLAFGFARPGSANPEPAKPASAGKKKGKNKNANAKDWQQWKEHDEEVVEDQFRDDLEKALTESQQEQKKTDDKQKKEQMNGGQEASAPEEQGKKKKKKDKAKTMSLEEFNNLQNPKAQKASDDHEEVSRPPIHHRVPSAKDKDSKFFNSAQHEAKQILKKDKMQEEYRKTCAVDNAVVAKLKNDIEIRDKTIKDLKQNIEKKENEMKQVKHRNKQLCVILAQGEMKDKAQVLLQVDELNNVKDELMEQVTSLTAELEKEKSKNRALKTEGDRAKTGKQK